VHTSDAVALQLKGGVPGVEFVKKGQRTVIHFLGAGLELLQILGRCIPSVVLHVYHMR
jgi:hypothetical protein